MSAFLLSVLDCQFTKSGEIVICGRDKEVKHLLPLIFLQITEVLILTDATGHFIVEPFPFQGSQFRFDGIFVAIEEVEYPFIHLTSASIDIDFCATCNSTNDNIYRCTANADTAFAHPTIRVGC